jgi:hypothetical protein
MKPINETADIARFIIAALAAYDDIMDNDKIGLADIPDFLKLMGPAEAALKGIQEVPAEILDLTTQEFDQLVAEIRPALVRLPDDVAEEVADEVLTIVKSVVAISNIIRAK